ncbi:MAG: phosphohydrolase, partial [Pyramidobacter sp.]|nr:phosphohydrolase [Pyramidobacter sp.]
MNPQHARLMAAAIEYDRGDARRIQHFVKVHDLAAAIGALEGLEPEAQFVLETAAILHDIGIHQAEA